MNKKKQPEDDSHKINRCFKMLAECNHAMIRTQDESELMQKICRIIIEHGGYLLAWVGFIDENKESKILFPVVFPEIERENLDKLNQRFNAWAATK